MRANAATALELLLPPGHDATPAVCCVKQPLTKQTGSSEFDDRPAAVSPNSRWIAGRGTKDPVESQMTVLGCSSNHNIGWLNLCCK